MTQQRFYKKPSSNVWLRPVAAFLTIIGSQGLAEPNLSSDSTYLSAVNEMSIGMALGDLAGQTYLPIAAPAQNLIERPECVLPEVEPAPMQVVTLCPSASLAVTGVNALTSPES